MSNTDALSQLQAATDRLKNHRPYTDSQVKSLMYEDAKTSRARRVKWAIALSIAIIILFAVVIYKLNHPQAFSESNDDGMSFLAMMLLLLAFIWLSLTQVYEFSPVACAADLWRNEALEPLNSTEIGCITGSVNDDPLIAGIVKEWLGIEKVLLRKRDLRVMEDYEQHYKQVKESKNAMEKLEASIASCTNQNTVIA